MLAFYLSLLDTEQEKETFTELYEKYKSTFLHTAMAITKNQHMAEDAVHNAFMTIIDKKENIFSIPCGKRRIYKAARAEANREPFAVVVSDDGRMISDYYHHFSKLFQGGLDDVEGSTLDGPLLDKFAPTRGWGLYDDFFSSGADIYMRIKGDIDAAYGDDPEKRKLFMLALDNAFETFVDFRIRDIASISIDKYKEEMKSSGGNDSESAKRPFSPIFNRKDFNADEFRKNLVQMGRDFVSAFTQGAKSDLGAAWENVDKLLGGMETASVNSISYNDFRTILGGLSDNQITSRYDTWDKALSSLANNTNLSDYMRDVFK